MQRAYELVMVLSPEVTDERLEEAVGRVTRMVTAQGGAVTATNPWGRRRLAYPIRRFLEGHYVHTELTMDPKVAADLERNLRLSEEVLRHLLVRLGE